jgi:hypothetical protein
MQVSLDTQSDHSKKYISLSSHAELAAVAERARGSQARFRWLKVAPQRVILRSLHNLKYVKITGAGRFLKAVEDRRKDADQFDILWCYRNRCEEERGIVLGRPFALRSVRTGKYVRAGVGERSLLAAVSDNANGWQRFVMRPSRWRPNEEIKVLQLPRAGECLYKSVTAFGIGRYVTYVTTREPALEVYHTRLGERRRGYFLEGERYQHVYALEGQEVPGLWELWLRGGPTIGCPKKDKVTIVIHHIP